MTEQASASQAVGSGGGVQPAQTSGGGDSGSGGGSTPTTVSLHQSGDSAGYTDSKSGNAFNQIGGLEGIAFSPNTGVPVTRVHWSVELFAYSGINPTPPNHAGENTQYLANWYSGQYTGKFYWPEDPGTYTILADVDFYGGGTAQGRMTITVQAPTLKTFTDTYQGVTKYNVAVAGGGQAANFVNAFDDGTTHKEGNVFNASISTSTLNSNLPASQYYYLQTVVPSEEDDYSDGRVVTFTPPSSTPMLDDGMGGQQPYMGIISPQISAGQAGPIPLPSVSDSPRFKTTAADLTAFNNVQPHLNKVIISGSFVMYVMMQPPSGIPTAIGQLSWKYGFTATFAFGAYNDAASWDLTATSPVYPADGNNVYQGSAVNLVPDWVGWVSVDLVKTTK